MMNNRIIEVRLVPDKGYGCFARCDIDKDFLVEKATTLLIPKAIFVSSASEILSNYVFAFDENNVVLALGMGSLFNHSGHPNVSFECANDQCVYFVSLRPIKTGEELTIDYGRDYIENTPEPLRTQMLTSKKKCTSTHFRISDVPNRHFRTVKS
jgi:SET domain-containing protein